MKISEVATFIRNNPKAVKSSKPFDMLRQAVESSGESETVTLSLAEVAALYAHFMPKTVRASAGVFDFAWVARAMAKKDVRYYLNYVYSDGARTIATDGRRMHVLAGQSLPQGYYTAAGDQVDEDAKYPDIDRVIPQYSQCQTWTLTAEELAACIVDTGDKGKDWAFAYMLQSGHKVNKKYFDDAINGMDSVTWHSLPHTPDPKRDYDRLNPNSILIRHGNVQAVVMSMSR